MVLHPVLEAYNLHHRRSARGFTSFFYRLLGIKSDTRLRYPQRRIVRITATDTNAQEYRRSGVHGQLLLATTMNTLHVL